MAGFWMAKWIVRSPLDTIALIHVNSKQNPEITQIFGVCPESIWLMAQAVSSFQNLKFRRMPAFNSALPENCS